MRVSVKKYIIAQKPYKVVISGFYNIWAYKYLLFCYGAGMGGVRETWANLHPFVTVFPHHIETLVQTLDNTITLILSRVSQ
jgi:hypothetical protein